jgi:ABC-type bacteriocin/lantibiotic exporter with double-glycine peptidase domain
MSPVTRTVVQSTEHILAVPFHRQASEFTCGPACLMMAMKFFKPSLRTTRRLEFDIWREANLVESYGTSKEGLALAAARRGFDVYTMGRPIRHSFVDAIADKVPGIDYEMLELLYNDTKAKFKSLSLKNISSRLELPKLKSVLEKSHVPILLTSTSLFGEKEDLPHWIVLTGYGKNSWYVNNPLGKQPNTRISYRVLEENIGYRQVRCALIVRGLRLQRPNSLFASSEVQWE